MGTLAMPYTFSDGTGSVIYAAQINANFGTVVDLLNNTNSDATVSLETVYANGASLGFDNDHGVQINGPINSTGSYYYYGTSPEGMKLASPNFGDTTSLVIENGAYGTGTRTGMRITQFQDVGGSTSSGFIFVDNDTSNLHLSTLVMDTAPFSVGTHVNLGGTWNGPHLTMGAYHFWVDASGKLRICNGSPTSDSDGAVVGDQTA
jgi:hypothetical protein